MTLLTSFRPRRHFSSGLIDDLDQLFGELVRSDNASDGRQFLEPATEIAESDEDYILRLDLPGVKKEDIQIEAVDNSLTISGERKNWRSDKHSPKLGFRHSYGEFRRTFSLPTTVDTSKVEAHFEDGILELVLPKAPAAQARRIEIQAGSGSRGNELKNVGSSN